MVKDMKLDKSLLHPGAAYAYHVHQNNEIIIINVASIPSSMIGTDYILVEDEETEAPVIQEMLEEVKEVVVEETEAKPVKKISHYSNRGKKK